MRGIQQESKRVPHFLTQGSCPIEGAWSKVTLTPDTGTQIECARGKSITEAFTNAEDTLAHHFPGATL